MLGPYRLKMQISGNELDLELLIQAATLRSYAAERLVWHWHEGVELIFMLLGTTSYEFQGGRTLPLAGGHFLVVPPHMRHRGLNNVRMPSKLAGLIFDLGRQARSSARPFTRAELDWLASCFSKSSGGVYPFGPALTELVPHLKAEMTAWNGNGLDLAQKAGLRTLICAAIIEAAREVGRHSVERPGKIVVAAMEYLRAHFDEPLKVSALAKHLGFSRARVFDLFTAETGLTPHGYLLQVRLDKATELLRKTQRSITEIGFATGFASGQHFSRVFHRYRGETPRECRESSLSTRRSGAFSCGSDGDRACVDAAHSVAGARGPRFHLGHAHPNQAPAR